MVKITSTVIMESNFNPDEETTIELCKTPSNWVNKDHPEFKPAFESKNLSNACPIMELSRFVMDNITDLKSIEEIKRSDLYKPTKVHIGRFTLAVSDVKDKGVYLFEKDLQKMMGPTKYYPLNFDKYDEFTKGRWYLVGDRLRKSYRAATKVDKVLHQIRNQNLTDSEKEDLITKLSPVKL